MTSNNNIEKEVWEKLQETEPMFAAMVQQFKQDYIKKPAINFYKWNGTSVTNVAAVLTYLSQHEPNSPVVTYLRDLAASFLAWYDGWWIWHRKPYYMHFPGHPCPIQNLRNTLTAKKP